MTEAITAVITGLLLALVQLLRERREHRLRVEGEIRTRDADRQADDRGKRLRGRDATDRA